MSKSRAVKFFQLPTAIAGILFSSAIAEASPITFSFEGVITQAFSTDAIYGTAIIGDTFSGNYTFDSDWVDYEPMIGNGQYIDFSGSPYTFNILLDGLQYSLSQPLISVGISVFNLPGNYNYIAFGSGVGSIDSLSVSTLLMSAGLVSNDEWNGGSESLPLVPPLLSDFIGSFVNLRVGTSGRLANDYVAQRCSVRFRGSHPRRTPAPRRWPQCYGLHGMAQEELLVASYT